MASLFTKTKKGVFYVLPTQLIIKIIGLMSVIVLARGLSVEAYGIYNFIIGALIIFSYLCNFGLGSSLQRFLPEYVKLEKNALLLKTVIFSHTFRLVLSGGVLFIANVTFNIWSIKFNIENYHAEFLVFSFGAFLYFQLEYLQIELSSLFRHGASSILQLIYSTLKFAGVIVVLYSGGQLLGVLLAETLAYLISFLVGVYYFVTRIYAPYAKYLRARSSERLEYRRIGRYSGYNALVTPGTILYSHSADYFVIAAMANPLELGLYALASRASNMLISVMPQTLLQSVLRPTIYYHSYAVDDQRAALHTIFRSLVVLIATFLFPVIIVMTVSSAYVIQYVFGADYVSAAGVFVVLLAFCVFTVIEFPSDMVLQVVEKVEVRAYAQIFSIYNLAAAILLMPVYGIMGVAWATGTAMMMKCLFYFYMAKRHVGVSLDWNALLKVAINAAVSALTVYLVILQHESALFLVLAFVAGAAAYLLMAYLNSPLTRDEKLLMNKFSKRRIFNV